MLLYTDGLEEAFPEGDDENQFGVDGIVRTLSESVELSLEEKARLELQENATIGEIENPAAGDGHHLSVPRATGEN